MQDNSGLRVNRTQFVAEMSDDNDGGRPVIFAEYHVHYHQNDYDDDSDDSDEFVPVEYVAVRNQRPKQQPRIWYVEQEQHQQQSPPQQLQQQRWNYPVQSPYYGRGPDPNNIPVKQTYGSHAACACIVLFFCGLIFGFIAFVLASK